MKLLLQLMGVVVLLAAIAPVAMAGGRMIAAFMMGKHIVPWLGITLLTMVLLVAGGMLALRVVMPLLAGIGSDMFGIIASALVLLVPPWAAWFAGKRMMEKKAQ
jgi:hypothetical protein